MNDTWQHTLLSLFLAATPLACSDDASSDEGSSTSPGPGSSSGDLPASSGDDPATTGEGEGSASTAGPPDTSGGTTTTSDGETTAVETCSGDLPANAIRFAHLDPSAGELDVCLVRTDGCVDGPIFADAPLGYGDVRFTSQGVETDTLVQWVEAGANDCDTATIVSEQTVDLTGDPATLMHSLATENPVALSTLPEALAEGRVYAVLIHGADAGSLTVAPDGDCTSLNPFFTAWDDVEPGTIGISPNGDLPYFNSSPPIEDYAIMVCNGDDKLGTFTITLVPGEVRTFFFHGDGDASPYGLVQCDDTESGSCSPL